MSSAFVYVSPSSPFIAASVEGKKLFKKELMPVGTWHKGEQTWRVDESLLLHWVDTFHKWIEAGHKVPMPVEHTEDPEKNRGFWVDMEVDVGASGVPALFGYADFAEGYEGLAKTTDVSVYSPPKWTDARKRTFIRPIKHVALTNDPVIPGLGGFQAIVASLGGRDVSKLLDLAAKFKLDATDEDSAALAIEAAMAMSMKSLAKKLGLEVGEGDDDASLEKAIVAAFKSKGKATPKPDDKKIEASAAMVQVVKDNRSMKLDKLLETGRVTKAVRDKLEEKFLSDEAIKASCSSPDGFEDAFAMLMANEPVMSFKQRTGPQDPVRLSNPMDEKQNPLLADAKRRAAAAQN